MKRTFVLINQSVRQRAREAISEAPEGFAVTIGEATRNLDQNAAQWPILQAFSDQLKWPVNGKMESLSPDEWKDILTAGFKQESVRLSQGLDGGIVMLGMRTSKMSKRQFSEWLDFLNATAVDRGIELDEVPA